MEKDYKNLIIAVLVAVAGLICLLSLVSYNVDDTGFYTTAPAYPVHNWIGPVGAWISFVLFICLGYSAFLIPVFIFTWVTVMFTSGLTTRPLLRAGGGLLTIVLVSAWLALLPVSGQKVMISSMNVTRGGLSGVIISKYLLSYLGTGGAHIVLLTAILLSLFLAAGHYLIVVSEKVFQGLKDFAANTRNFEWLPRFRFFNKTEQTSERLRIKSTVRPERKSNIKPQTARPSVRNSAESLKGTASWDKTAGTAAAENREIKIINKETRRERKERKRQEKKHSKSPVEAAVNVSAAEFELPGVELLDSPPPVAQRKIEEDLQASARRLEDTLRDFGIECKADQIERGPVVTRYELLPAPGVKVNRITSLSDDIALAMKAHSVRIVAPIPGKAAVGVEVPNMVSSMVFMRDIVESPEFYDTKSKLPIVLGKDISGKSIVADLSDMPHMLIAGTTGSGKTVCVNSLIASLLFKLSPDEVKFIMVDPKMVELAMYNGLPHLLCPVVTEPKKVSGALGWVVNEMERRYRVFAKIGVRNIAGYNDLYGENEFAGMETIDGKSFESESSREDPSENPNPGRLPYIVVMIDELADLMLVASAEIETAIARLAQLSRAVGIHIVLATQRPSVDVITGVIKANFPARISFQVASKVDSRTVLDMNGAEKLLGKGDMLFLKPGTSKPIRAQGVLISDKELNRVVEFIKLQRSAEYNQQVLAHQKKKTALEAGEKDDFYDDAVELILATGQASVSILQRRMRLGYTRAARLIDQMEAEGIVGPYQGSKPREILVDRPGEDEKL